ncbi:oqxB_1_EU370913 [Escherichia coli]|nr:oqxB_1_EU370913 [Escherichia coli]
MPNFFIDRPIFAWVIAIIIMLAGGLAILKLPVAQYPTIAPPAVTISASYPGADAKTVQDTVTQVIEQNMNGIDNLMYMSSNSDSTGTVQITLTLSLVLMRISRRFRCRTNCSWRCRCCRKKFSSKG